MTTTRRVARKVVAKKTVKKSAAPKKEYPAKNVEVKVEVTIMVALGAGDPRSIEQVRDDIKADLTSEGSKTQAKLVTNLGGYYLVDGRVCLPDDYDPKTRGFKPGAHPPLWAMGPDEREILKRVEREKSLPKMAQQPQNLRTTQETDALHAKEKRIAKTKAALDDLHENTEWGKQKQREREEAAQSASDDEEFEEDEFAFDEEDEEEEPYYDEEDEEEDEDEEEPFEAEWDEDDPMNDSVAEAAVEEQTSSALAKLKTGKTNGKTVRKVTTVAKPVVRKRVVKRR